RTRQRLRRLNFSRYQSRLTNFGASLARRKSAARVGAVAAVYDRQKLKDSPGNTRQRAGARASSFGGKSNPKGTAAGKDRDQNYSDTRRQSQSYRSSGRTKRSIHGGNRARASCRGRGYCGS